jgi:hypothetical protein
LTQTTFTLEERRSSVFRRADRFVQVLARRINRETKQPVEAGIPSVTFQEDGSLLAVCRVKVGNVCTYLVHVQEGGLSQVFAPGHSTPIPLHQVLQLVH